jgi:hypothetical protein
MVRLVSSKSVACVASKTARVQNFSTNGVGLQHLDVSRKNRDVVDKSVPCRPAANPFDTVQSGPIYSK